MKFNPQLRKELDNYKEYIILVEGKTDVQTLKSLGFNFVHAVHIDRKPLRERIEEICSKLSKKDKVCILTNLNKKGKKLYMYIKPIIREKNIKLDSSLRGLILKARITEISNLEKFMKKIENIH